MSSNMSALTVLVKAEANKKSATTNAEAKVIPFIVSRFSELIDAFSSPQRTVRSSKRTDFLNSFKIFEMFYLKNV